jgi:hypothetical protein
LSGLDRIGEFWGYLQSRAFAELLIDCEEDRALRAVLVGMLRGWSGESSAARRRAGAVDRGDQREPNLYLSTMT